MANFERYLKKRNYGFSIMKDSQFEQARKLQRISSRKEKGINLTVPLLWQRKKSRFFTTKKIWTSTPEALLNTVWTTILFISVFVAARGSETCVGETWQLRQITNGEKSVEYCERQTKNRTGDNPWDVRKIKPKTFSVFGSEKRSSWRLQITEKRSTKMNAWETCHFTEL